MNTIAVVPGYNPGPPVKKVLEKIRHYVPEIIYIDDGSNDKSPSFAKQVSNVKILTHQNNQGKGWALATGIDYVLKNTRANQAVFIDSDGQHDPADIPKLQTAQLDNDADIVIGGRMQDQRGMPALRRFSNSLSSSLISLAARRRITDSQSGFRLLRREVLEKVPWKPGRYESETDFIIRAARNDFKIVTTPIRTIYSDEIQSYYHNLKDTVRIAGVIAKRIW